MEIYKQKTKKIILKICNIISEKLGIGELNRMIAMDRRLTISNYLNTHLYNNPKYTNSNRLNKYEYSIRSQDGADGIIEEIFKRIGTTNKQFLEFGVGDGLQNNTATLLLSGWSGLWFEGDSDRDNNSVLESNLNQYIKNKQLRIVPAFITAENVEEMFDKNNVNKDLDFLSIDIDGNDYWVWKALTKYEPRVVVVEFNSLYGSHLSIVPKYDKKYIWKRTAFFGSSISAFEKLGRAKGYTLVASSFVGINLFFVRTDLIKDKFDTSLTVPEIFESQKVFLLQPTKYPTNFVETEVL